MYVIAGVTGHVGSVIANTLLANGEKVRVIVRDHAKGAPFVAKGAEVAVGTLEDTAFLTKTLMGAKAAFLMVPPNMAVPDFRAYQKTVGVSIVKSVGNAKVPHTVLLSSIGADLPAGTGPIAGLHAIENGLRENGTVLTALRPGFFMENVVPMIGAANAMGIYPSFVPEGVPMHMVATLDIGLAAAKAIVETPVKHRIIDINGPAYTAAEVTTLLAKVVHKPLNTVYIPAEGRVGAMVQSGLPVGAAELYNEMYNAFAAGIMTPKGDTFVHGHTTLEHVLTHLS